MLRLCYRYNTFRAMLTMNQEVHGDSGTIDLGRMARNGNEKDCRQTDTLEVGRT